MERGVVCGRRVGNSVLLKPKRLLQTQAKKKNGARGAKDACITTFDSANREKRKKTN